MSDPLINKKGEDLPGIRNEMIFALDFFLRNEDFAHQPSQKPNIRQVMAPPSWKIAREADGECKTLA